MINCHLRRIQHDKHTMPVLIRTHTHAYDELTYYISGNGTTQIGDRVYPYRAGCFAFYRAGCLHNEDNAAACRVIWTHFDFELEGITLREGVFEDPCGVLLALIRKLRSTALECREHRDVLIESRLAEVIATAAVLQKKPATVREDADWQQVLDYIDENYNASVDFARLAADRHYSYDRFRHLFCEKFGMPPYAYLLHRRLAHAQLMLEKTDSTLTEIAFDCGFHSSSQFTNIFKKYVGSTPGDYRRETRG